MLFAISRLARLLAQRVSEEKPVPGLAYASGFRIPLACASGLRVLLAYASGFRIRLAYASGCD